MDDQQLTLARKFYNLFQGAAAAYGTEEGGCIRESITWDVVGGHLFGDKPIGVYPVIKGVCKWGCVDYDEGDQISFEKAKRLHGALAAIGIPAHLERSRSKGWHVWVFAASAVPAATMRRALLAACKVAQAESKEINPKSETLPEGSLGNYVRLPYPKGADHEGRRMIWVKESGVWGLPLSLEEFLAEAKLASPTQLELAASRWQPPVPQSRVELNQAVDGEDPTDLIAQLPGLAYTIWKEGPLDGSDRSGTLMRFCREVRDHGFTAIQAFRLVASADRRWGKYSTRADGGASEIAKIVGRFYS